MPAERLPMRQIRDILRLKWECSLSERKIAVSVGAARSTVGDYIRRAEAAGFNWPQVQEMEDEELEARLFTTRHWFVDSGNASLWKCGTGLDRTAGGSQSSL